MHLLVVEDEPNMAQQLGGCLPGSEAQRNNVSNKVDQFDPAKGRYETS